MIFCKKYKSLSLFIGSISKSFKCLPYLQWRFFTGNLHLTENDGWLSQRLSWHWIHKQAPLHYENTQQTVLHLFVAHNWHCWQYHASRQDAGHRSKTMEDKWIKTVKVHRWPRYVFQSRATDASIHSYWSRWCNELNLQLEYCFQIEKSNIEQQPTPRVIAVQPHHRLAHQNKSRLYIYVWGLKCLVSSFWL